MGKPKTLLVDLSEHALSCGAESIEVEYDKGYEWVYARKGDVTFTVAKFKSTGKDAEELRDDLYAALKKPVRMAFGGQVWVLQPHVHSKFGEDAFRVRFEHAPKRPASEQPSFTKKQGQYLAFISTYLKLHGRPPSEADIQAYFKTTPPSVHQMILTLELNGLIERTPRQSRSIRVLLPPEQLPRLE